MLHLCTSILNESDLLEAISLHIMLNISKHYLARNGDHLPKVCVAC